MSFTYGFYDSINHDRTYNARQMSEIFDGIINDGVFESIGSKFMVSAVSGMQIKVGSGRAWFNHTWTNNDSDMPLTLDAAEPLYKRIDAIVLEVNENQDTRANSIKIIKGTPASTPSKPTLINTDGIHQHILAWITINGGATAITQANIENAVGTSATPYVTAILQVTNVDQLLAQWDAQFGEWFRNIQSQMEGDVATHLQQQITDNWNSTVSMVSDASKTVLDVSKNALVKVKTDFDTCRLVKTVAGDCVNTNYADLYTTDHYYMYAWNRKLYMTGFDSTGHPGIVEYGTDGQYANQWGASDYPVSSYSSYMYLAGLVASPNGSAIAARAQTSEWMLIDLQHRIITPIGYNMLQWGCGVTENYKFHFRASNNSYRYVYYGPRNSSGYIPTSNSISLGTGMSSSRYDCTVVGVYGDTIWYIDMGYAGSQSPALGMISLGSSPQHVPGVQIFNGIDSANFNPIYYNASYAYFSISCDGSNVKTKVLRINLSNGTTNWSDVVSSQGVPNNTAFAYARSAYYIGTSNNVSYFTAYSSGSSDRGYLAMNCSTMELTSFSRSGGDIERPLSPKEMYGFENSCSGVYDGYLIQGNRLYKLPAFESRRVRGPRYAPVTSSVSFLTDAYMCPRDNGNVYFAGNTSSEAPIGYSGEYSASNGTGILMGPPKRTVVDIVT